MLSREDPIPPSSCPLFANETNAGAKSSTWVLQKVMEIRHLLGLSGEGFKEEFIALLTSIEVSHSQKESTSSSKLGNKENRELKRLSCSINYDSKGGNSRRGRVKGRAMLGSLWSLSCYYGM